MATGATVPAENPELVTAREGEAIGALLAYLALDDKRFCNIIVHSGGIGVSMLIIDGRGESGGEGKTLSQAIERVIERHQRGIPL